VTFRLLRTFQKDFRNLPRDIQARTEGKLRLFAQDPWHPSLRVKKMQGTRNIWEGSITMSYGFTFHRENDTIVRRRVGPHDILKKESK